MRTGRRPPSHAGLAARAVCLSAAIATALTAPSAAAGEAFARDETPLPAGVVGDTGQAGAEQASSGSSGSFVRMIVGLAVVLAVIYGLYWLAKVYRKTKLRGQSDGRLEVVATTALGPNRSVHLIRVGEELVLVGAAEHGVTKLRVYGPDEAALLAPLLEASATVQRLAPPRRPAGGRRLAQKVDDLRWRTVR